MRPVMIAPELLEILVCPELRVAVRPADGEVLSRVNAAVASGSLLNRGGELVREPLAEGLLRVDGLVLYPVRDGIPIMLIDEGIPLQTLP